MKNILILLLVSFFALEINAQNRAVPTSFGKSGSASILLIDKEIKVSKDKTNSIFRFEIINNNPYPIYIPQPEIIIGSVPQYFDLQNISVECEQEFMSMNVRSSAEFILIPASGSKEFKLHSAFFQNSCLRDDRPENAFLVYRAIASNEEDDFVKNELIKRDRNSRDVTEYILSTTLRSAPIKIIYE